MRLIRPPRPVHPSWKDDARTLRALRLKSRSGLTLAEIGKLLNISRAYVHQVIRTGEWSPKRGRVDTPEQKFQRKLKRTYAKGTDPSSTPSDPGALSGG